MVRFDDIVEKAETYIGEKDVAVLRKAYVFAGQAHKGQVRRSGEPYLSHPLEVTGLPGRHEARPDDASSPASSTTSSRTPTTTAAELREAFGKEVADLVEGVTKISRVQDVVAGGPPGRDHPQDHPGHDRRHPGHLHQAGRPHPQPARPSSFLDEESAAADRRARPWTSTRPSPTASAWAGSRPSSRTCRSATSRPRNTAKIAAAIDPQRKAAEADLGGHEADPGRAPRRPTACRPRSSPGSSGRTASGSKMRRRDIDFDQVFDLLALRVITDTVKDCYAVLGIIHQRWPHLPQRFRDFIAMPKPNLYQALHTTVITEGRKTLRDPDPDPGDARPRRERHRRPLALQGRRAARADRRRTGASIGSGRWPPSSKSRRTPRSS
ncbi:MAG: HD domain-containing protein [Anaerotruncus sp.]|nr:HD domain-containing protein [Anaerotruncus sp.]